MQINEKILPVNSSLPASFGDTRQVCLMDIETTGLARKNARIAYAGCAYLAKGQWTARQWLAESKEEEPRILADYLEFLSQWPVLVHFNGTSFDLPCLRRRCGLYDIPCPLDGKENLDLYRLLKPLRRIFPLERSSQRALETLLGQMRQPDDNDLTMLPHLLPLLAYAALGRELESVQDCRLLFDEDGGKLQLDLGLYDTLPLGFSCPCGAFYLKAEDKRLSLLIYGRQATLKYFMDDYKNYYYLPDEDMAVHKSVAAFAGKGSRVPAKKATCYIKKEGLFLPQKDPLFVPVFRESYESRGLWFFADSLSLSDKAALLAYARSLLSDFPSKGDTLWPC